MPDRYKSFPQDMLSYFKSSKMPMLRKPVRFLRAWFFPLEGLPVKKRIQGCQKTDDLKNRLAIFMPPGVLGGIITFLSL